jgi:hypothetical protein
MTRCDRCDSFVPVGHKRCPDCRRRDSVVVGLLALAGVFLLGFVAGALAAS